MIMEDQVFSTAADGADFSQITLMLSTHSTGYLCQEERDQDMDAQDVAVIHHSPEDPVVKKCQQGRPVTVDSENVSIGTQSTKSETDVEDHMEVDFTTHPHHQDWGSHDCSCVQFAKQSAHQDWLWTDISNLSIHSPGVLVAQTVMWCSTTCEKSQVIRQMCKECTRWLASTAIIIQFPRPR